MGLMVHTEGVYQDTWGYSLDYSYMDLGQDIYLGDNQRGSLSGNAYQGVFEAKGFKRYQYDFGTIDYMAGIRWWETKGDVSVSTNGIVGASTTGDVDVDWVDYVIGARLNLPINNAWDYYLDVDMGAGADTSFTSQMLTGFKYEVNDWSSLKLGYKAVWVDYDDEKELAYNTTTHGFTIGYAVNF